MKRHAAVRRRDPPVYLASRSPRRRALLKKHGIRFSTVPSRYAERIHPDLGAAANALRLARGKAMAAGRPGREGVVIGADTLVAMGGRIMGKARSRAHAFRMLKSFSGRSQWVYTGVALRDLRTGKIEVFCERSKVTFARMSDKDIHDYLRHGEYRGKAGAFGLQGRGARHIARVSGSRSNVVGLPVERLKRILKKFLRNLRALRPGPRALRGDRARIPRGRRAAN